MKPNTYEWHSCSHQSQNLRECLLLQNCQYLATIYCKLL